MLPLSYMSTYYYYFFFKLNIPSVRWTYAAYAANAPRMRRISEEFVPCVSFKRMMRMSNILSVRLCFRHVPDLQEVGQ